VKRKWVPVAVAVLVLAAATMIANRRGYRFGANTLVRCKSGHLFTTIWIPGISLKSVRLGWFRWQRCPLCEHWSFVKPVRAVDLSDEELRAAGEVHDVRIP